MAAVVEKYYAKYAPENAVRQLLRVIEGGRNSKVTGTKTGTTGQQVHCSASSHLRFAGAEKLPLQYGKLS